jgi:hypothetical protein
MVANMDLYIENTETDKANAFSGALTFTNVGMFEDGAG